MFAGLVLVKVSKTSNREQDDRSQRLEAQLENMLRSDIEFGRGLPPPTEFFSGSDSLPALHLKFPGPLSYLYPPEIVPYNVRRARQVQTCRRR